MAPYHPSPSLPSSLPLRILSHASLLPTCLATWRRRGAEGGKVGWGYPYLASRGTWMASHASLPAFKGCLTSFLQLPTCLATWESSREGTPKLRKEGET